MAIEAGDLVRFKNDALKASNSCGCMQRTRYKGGYKRFRGKQKIAKVIRVVENYWDWRSRTHNQVVELDMPDDLFHRPTRMISIHLLTLFRKGTTCSTKTPLRILGVGR